MNRMHKVASGCWLSQQNNALDSEQDDKESPTSLKRHKTFQLGWPDEKSAPTGRALEHLQSGNTVPDESGIRPVL